MPNSEPELSLVPGRECGDCALCCKVFPIPETGKSDFALCPSARPPHGCSIHAARPDTCRDFFCLWRLDGSLGEEWKPSVAGFVLHDPSPWALLISCDVDNPEACRREPYDGQIRDWAVEMQRRQLLMGRRVGAKTYVVLRDREVELDG
jgi:hypothetical protein